jgi:hypothetical protein
MQHFIEQRWQRTGQPGGCVLARSGSICGTRALSFLLVATLLLITADRLPAPILEVPQSPTPGPTVAPAAQPRKSSSKPKSKPSGAAQFAGTWTGRITIGKFADTDVRLVISTDGRSVAQTSQAGVWTRPLAYDGKLLAWQTGSTDAVAWTLALNPNEQSALVTRIWSGIQTRGIFKRARSTEAAPNTVRVPRAKGHWENQQNWNPGGGHTRVWIPTQ